MKRCIIVCLILCLISPISIEANKKNELVYPYLKYYDLMFKANVEVNEVVSQKIGEQELTVLLSRNARQFLNAVIKNNVKNSN